MDIIMNQFANRFDGTATAGRKGIAYDWQSLMAASGVAAIETELSELVMHSLVLESAE